MNHVDYALTIEGNELWIEILSQQETVKSWGGRNDKPLSFVASNGITLMSANIPQIIPEEKTVYLLGHDKNCRKSAKVAFPPSLDDLPGDYQGHWAALDFSLEIEQAISELDKKGWDS